MSFKINPIRGTSLLQIPPSAVSDLRNIHNLEPGMIEQAINILEAWILKQDHIIKKDYSKYLLHFFVVMGSSSYS